MAYQDGTFQLLNPNVNPLNLQIEPLQSSVLCTVTRSPSSLPHLRGRETAMLYKPLTDRSLVCFTPVEVPQATV